MMRKSTRILLMLAATVLPACSVRDNVPSEYGSLKLRLHQDLGVETLTKSAGAPASRSVERKARRHNPDRIIRNVKKNGYLCGGFDIE